MKKMSLLAIAALAAAAIAAPFKVIGYFPYWAQYSQFMPKDVRYQFVTHIHYASLAPAEDGSIAFADENDAPQFEELAKNAAENKVSLIASIGGFEVEGNLKAIAEDDSKLSAFCDAAAEWVEKYNLGGVELDWQNATGEDAAAIGKLVGALKSKLSSKEVAVLTYASSVDAYSDALNQADYVVLMLGDQMSDSESSVKPNLSKQDIAGAVDGLAGKGVSKDKIVPVVSLYGKSFAGASGLGSSHQGVGSGNEGFIPYKELMKKFEAPDYKVSFDEASASEVAVSDAETIVFTGIPSMKALCGLVKDEGLAGIAAYDLSQDHNESIVSLMVTIGLQLRPGVDYSGKKRK
ncbi:glycoside hydrolase family 18 protein [uncultured Fibrobacter sp.]|uniref:glycoside hydrolase family 18 protein n=1 Tax=uncultured Fibrobacter sp. TaxID=261512 RepID=UPI0025DCBC60|nr:glycoside hydrolase family 18 protein [uncultured Fibrobacter sp.]